ncbi:MAG: hypothetical protein QOH12_2274 [Solirubrobacteraceae bacterium]|jgi:hypothetical protein|nr:hypothetical protein [Solirubrobacteraceae bacterium]
MWIRRSTVAAGLAVVSGIAGSGTSLASVSASVPSRCPTKAPVPIVVGPHGSGPVLPGGAASIRLCRYGSLDAKQRLEGQHLTRSNVVIQSLTKRLNALPGLPPGAMACPADDASEILLLTRGRNGAAANVTVGLRGCRIVASTTGAATRLDLSDNGQPLLRQLVRLTA